MELLDYEKEHLATLRPLLPECTVLLKSNGDFPLAAAGELALYGSGARHTVKGGTGSGEVNGRFFVNVEDGLKDAGFIITTANWLNTYDTILIQAKKAFYEGLRAKAKAEHTNVLMAAMGAVFPEPEYSLALDGKGDVAVYVVSRISGEGNDRQAIKGDVYLTDTEIRDINALNDKYAKFMLVLNVGGPVVLSPVNGVKNILVMSQLGVESGAALADILLGKESPSGKLTTTWSTWADYKEMDFGDKDDTRYNEGVYVGYRYFDSVGKKPLYPFGYGLSYTTFALDAPAVTVAGSKVTVSVKVNNTGNCAGKEVVQVYVSVPAGKLDQPYQALAGFAKTGKLAAGGSETVEVTFDLAESASYDVETESYILEAGTYVVRVGTSSADTVVAATVTLKETVTTLKAKNVLGKPDFTDWKPESPAAKAEVPAGTANFDLAAADFATVTVDYETKYDIDPDVKALSDEELIKLNIGNFGGGMGPLSAIGESSTTVAGAAGETAHIRNWPYSVMADGPAGLRLAQQYFLDEKGAHGIGSALPESMNELMGGFLKFVMGAMNKKPKKGAEIKTQYATAIPIGTAIAQSFNVELAEQCGDVVGNEMERMNVQYWLAPALNIHRSILCGRNFEYFSEDPLVAGKFAAAITKGVQKHPGCSTTIKHYCANNQETNRYGNNSQVSERAMREIYLRGFGICVRESQPMALMTSYNLLNGTHTSEHRGLIDAILRAEYGYKGVVMTDWVIALMNAKGKYRSPNAALVAASGNDLFMPGSSREFKEIKAGLADGSVTREQLEINATRVVRMARKLAKK